MVWHRCDRAIWPRSRCRSQHTGIARNGVATISTATSRSTIATSCIAADRNTAIPAGSVATLSIGSGCVTTNASNILSPGNQLASYRAAGSVASLARAARCVATSRIRLHGIRTGVATRARTALFTICDHIRGRGAAGDPVDMDSARLISVSIDRSTMRAAAVAVISIVILRIIDRARHDRGITRNASKRQRYHRGAFDRRFGEIEIAADRQASGDGHIGCTASSGTSSCISSSMCVATHAWATGTITGDHLDASRCSTGCVATGRATVAGITRTSGASGARAIACICGCIAGRRRRASSTGSAVPTIAARCAPGGGGRSIATSYDMLGISITRIHDFDSRCAGAIMPFGHTGHGVTTVTGITTCTAASSSCSSALGRSTSTTGARTTDSSTTSATATSTALVLPTVGRATGRITAQCGPANGRSAGTAAANRIASNGIATGPIATSRTRESRIGDCVSGRNSAESRVATDVISTRGVSTGSSRAISAVAAIGRTAGISIATIATRRSDAAKYGAALSRTDIRHRTGSSKLGKLAGHFLADEIGIGDGIQQARSIATAGDDRTTCDIPGGCATSRNLNFYIATTGSSALGRAAI